MTLAQSLLSLPDVDLLWSVLTLRNYNTRLVVLSTTTLGIASGLVGSFLLLRKRSLMGDAMSHACLPGIAMMFIVMVAMGQSSLAEGWIGYLDSGSWQQRISQEGVTLAKAVHWLGIDRWPSRIATGKWLPGLLLGATVTGLGGVWLVLAIRNTTRIKDDAAMGIVLSVFFGLGVALLTLIQTMPGTSAAGLEYFIYGKAASMVMQDAILICAVAITTVIAAIMLLKELTLLCFDEGYASSQGWPVHRLDVIMLALVAAVTVVGLQAVGLILIIAFLITPAAAARFWTNDLRLMLWLAAVIGGLSGWLGASLSAVQPDAPAGAVIVLTASAVFVISMMVGPTRGVIPRLVTYRRLARKTGRQHLLRSVFEVLETSQHPEVGEAVNRPVPFDQLLDQRSWTRHQLLRLIRTAKREDHIEQFDGQSLLLSEAGFGEAVRTTRNHRLWEMYLIQHADVATAHVDRDADMVEHVLGSDMVRQLEAELVRRGRLLVPPSPHALPTGAAP